MRYKTVLSYRGTTFLGWQNQLQGRTVQGVVEDTLSRYTKQEIPVVGCGRTDSGVHANNYVLHFDANLNLTPKDIEVLNKMLPVDIVIHSVSEIAPGFHARFDAKRRSYVYHISKNKMPFRADQYWHYPQFSQLNHDLIHQAAHELMNYQDFYTFCKTQSDVDNYRCELYQSSWELTEFGAVYRISANRFLRGMVRLIVGMLIRVGEERMHLSEVKQALANQSHLDKAYSAPATGLFLSKISYN